MEACLAEEGVGGRRDARVCTGRLKFAGFVHSEYSILAEMNMEMRMPKAESRASVLPEFDADKATHVGYRHLDLLDPVFFPLCYVVHEPQHAHRRKYSPANPLVLSGISSPRGEP